MRKQWCPTHQGYHGPPFCNKDGTSKPPEPDMDDSRDMERSVDWTCPKCRLKNIASFEPVKEHEYCLYCGAELADLPDTPGPDDVVERLKDFDTTMRRGFDLSDEHVDEPSLVDDAIAEIESERRWANHYHKKWLGLREALDWLQDKGCRKGYPTCLERHPNDKNQWCFSCIATEALKEEKGDED